MLFSHSMRMPTDLANVLAARSCSFSEVLSSPAWDFEETAAQEAMRNRLGEGV